MSHPVRGGHVAGGKGSSSNISAEKTRQKGNFSSQEKKET